MTSSRLVVLSLLGLLLLSPAAAQPVGPSPQWCSQSFRVSAGATALTQFVAAAVGERIVVCGYELNAGAAAATFGLTYGTGSNCGTGTTTLTPAFSLGINGVLVSRGVVGLQSPLGQALCYVITGTGPMNAVVYFDQY